MRSAQKNNRSRGRGNRKGGGGGGNVVNRVYDSAGPEGKVRGTPQQIIDKYLSLARDAQTSGDRVVSENFLQHAEHYQRMLIQAASTQEQSRRELDRIRQATTTATGRRHRASGSRSSTGMMEAPTIRAPTVLARTIPVPTIPAPTILARASPAPATRAPAARADVARAPTTRRRTRSAA